MIKVRVLGENTVPVGVEQQEAVGVELKQSINYIANVDYIALKNKPAINGHTLVGNKTCYEIDICRIENTEIEKLINASL